MGHFQGISRLSLQGDMREGGMNFVEVCVPPPPVYIEFYGDIAVAEDNMTPNTACLAFNATK